MKDWIKKNHKRLWFSGVVGMGFGFIIEVIVGIWREEPISSLIMVPLMIGGAIGAWFILTNNNDFKK